MQQQPNDPIFDPQQQGIKQSRIKVGDITKAQIRDAVRGAATSGTGKGKVGKGKGKAGMTKKEYRARLAAAAKKRAKQQAMKEKAVEKQAILQQKQQKAIQPIIQNVIKNVTTAAVSKPQGKSPSKHQGKSPHQGKSASSAKRYRTNRFHSSSIPDPYHLGQAKDYPEKHRRYKIGLKHINKPGLKRLARRGGVKRLSGRQDMYQETRNNVYDFLHKVIHDATVITQLGRRKTVTALDVIQALRRQGRNVYGVAQQKTNT